MQRNAIILACFCIPLVPIAIGIGSVNCFSQRQESGAPTGLPGSPESGKTDESLGLRKSEARYPFVHYTPREGLANNRTRLIYQDSKGKLYIATYGGLSIYDGTRFINYNPRNGLASYLVNDFAEMGDDSIWVIPNANKIQCIVRGKLTDFVPDDKFTPLVNSLIKCSDGFYYALADEGLFRFENSRFIKISIAGLPPGVPAKTFLGGVEIEKKLFLLSNPDYKGNGSNLLVYDLSKKKLLAYNDNLHLASLFNPWGNELWLATMTGLFRMEKIGEDGRPITLGRLPQSYHIPKDLVPHFMYKDRQSNLWMATATGVYRIKKDGETTLFRVKNGLTTDPQSSIFQDRENNIWFTNEQTGLSKLCNQQLAYYPSENQTYFPTAIFIGPSSDSVWLYDGNHHQLMLQLPNGQVREYVSNETSPAYSRFVSAHEQYVLSGTKIYRWNAPGGGNRYSLSLKYNDSSSIFGFVTTVVDTGGHLITTSNKLVLLTKNNVVTQPLDYMVDQITLDNKNRVWAASRSNRLFCFEVSGSGDNVNLLLLRKFESIVKSSPRSIAADKEGNIWIGTRDAGLFYLQIDNVTIRSMRQATTVDGLSENFVNYLYCDKDNNIWACTPSGLDKVKIVKDHFLVENITRSNNFYFPIYSVQQTRSGTFWIQSSSGILIYNPAREPMSGWKPQLSFSNFIFSKSGQLPIPPRGQLKYFQNNLVFQLSAPTFIDEKQTRFSYLLQGSGQENWSEPSTDASVNFVNLPPGSYTLKAKAIFLHGLYPNAESSYSFTILPPWWQTWWFKLLSGLLLLTFSLLVLRYYIKRKLELQRAMLEKRRAIEKERTRIATDMHDDLGAGLSQIKFLSESIGMKKQQHLPFEEEISNIRIFSVDMIDKMGEIVWALNEKNDTLSDLLSYTRSYAAEYLEQNGISCHVEEPDVIPQDYVSSEFRRNIYLTVKETLHNIVKHAQATEVIITITISNSLNIEIKDNGIGIDIAKSRSNGNGLINMNNRIQELKGRFEIISNNGTQVNIAVPLNQ